MDLHGLPLIFEPSVCAPRAAARISSAWPCKIRSWCERFCNFCLGAAQEDWTATSSGTPKCIFHAGIAGGPLDLYSMKSNWSVSKPLFTFPVNPSLQGIQDHWNKQITVWLVRTWALRTRNIIQIDSVGAKSNCSPRNVPTVHAIDWSAAGAQSISRGTSALSLRPNGHRAHCLPVWHGYIVNVKNLKKQRDLVHSFPTCPNTVPWFPPGPAPPCFEGRTHLVDDTTTCGTPSPKSHTMNITERPEKSSWCLLIEGHVGPSPVPVKVAAIAASFFEQFQILERTVLQVGFINAISDGLKRNPCEKTCHASTWNPIGNVTPQ